MEEEDWQEELRVSLHVKKAKLGGHGGLEGSPLDRKHRMSRKMLEIDQQGRLAPHWPGQGGGRAMSWTLQACSHQP